LKRKKNHIDQLNAKKKACNERTWKANQES
jgi:hypothetical protein